MRQLELTRGSEKALRSYHAGHGRAFVSQGDEHTTVSFDFGFYKTERGYVLYLGTAKSIILTEEQAAVVHHYAVDQTTGE